MDLLPNTSMLIKYDFPLLTNHTAISWPSQEKLVRGIRQEERATDVSSILFSTPEIISDFDYLCKSTEFLPAQTLAELGPLLFTRVVH